MLYYESNDDQDKAFTICAHYKHGFMLKNIAYTAGTKLVEVTHPSDESISLLFKQDHGADCSDLHKLAEPIGFISEQEYIDLVSTGETWMKELFNGDANTYTQHDLELNIIYDEASGNFTRQTNPNGIKEFYVPGLDENFPITLSSDHGAYKLEEISINKQTPQSVLTETNTGITKICILRAKSGWKNSLDIQIKMIKSEMAFSNQFALCESMGARLPYLSDLNQVSFIYAFVDSQLDEYETFSVMKTNHLFSKDASVTEYDIGAPIDALAKISNVNVEKKSNYTDGNPITQSSVMCVKNGSPYIDFTFGNETVSYDSETFTHKSFDKDVSFEWNELHSVKMTRHVFHLDRKEDTSYARPRFTVDHLRNYCESIDSYPEKCWEYNWIDEKTHCPYLQEMSSAGWLYPEPLAKEEQKCSHDELTYSQENGKISRLRLERRELTLDEAKQRCNSFGMTIYTPYSNSEANQLLKWFRGKNAWLGSTTKLVFWTNLERADDETANIVAPNDVIQKKHFQKYIEKNSICFRNNDSSSDGTGVAGASECNDDDDATRHHFMCVERIEAGYKQQRKVVINYEHNAKEVIIDFVPSVHAIRFRNNSLLNKTDEGWSERAIPEKIPGSEHYKIPFSYIGMTPWNGAKLSTRYFESEFINLQVTSRFFEDSWKGFLILF